MEDRLLSLACTVFWIALTFCLIYKNPQGLAQTLHIPDDPTRHNTVYPVIFAMIQFMLFSWSLFHRKLINTQKLYPALCGVVNFQNYKKEITDTNIFSPYFCQICDTWKKPSGYTVYCKLAGASIILIIFAGSGYIAYISTKNYLVLRK